MATTYELCNYHGRFGYGISRRTCYLVAAASHALVSAGAHIVIGHSGNESSAETVWCFYATDDEHLVLFFLSLSLALSFSIWILMNEMFVICVKWMRYACMDCSSFEFSHSWLCCCKTALGAMPQATSSHKRHYKTILEPRETRFACEPHETMRNQWALLSYDCDIFGIVSIFSMFDTRFSRPNPCKNRLRSWKSDSCE